MTKEQILELIKLLSALESWSFSAGQTMPNYLSVRIDTQMDALTRELLTLPRVEQCPIPEQIKPDSTGEVIHTVN